MYKGSEFSGIHSVAGRTRPGVVFAVLLLLLAPLSGALPLRLSVAGAPELF